MRSITTIAAAAVLSIAGAAQAQDASYGPGTFQYKVETQVHATQEMMGQTQEALKETQLVKHLERGGVDGVSPEVAQEVGVLLQDKDRDRGPGQEESEHHAGRPAPDHAAARRDPAGLRARPG